MTPGLPVDQLASERRIRLTQALNDVADGDRTAFALLYRLTAPKLFGICLRICGTRAVAEDVLQDVYLTIWRRAGGYDPGRASPITWLATIARNRAIDWRRANRLAPTDTDAVLALLPNPSPRADDELTAEQDYRLLMRCLDELDASCRNAIRDASFSGLTYSELAARGACRSAR